MLLLLDSCATGTANTDRGHGIMEFIAACGFNSSANPVGPDSFTRALITELTLLQNVPSFTYPGFETGCRSVGKCKSHLYMSC